MIDFFDEDFPLTKKQEELAKKRREEEAEKAAAETADDGDDATEILPDEPEVSAPDSVQNPTEVQSSDDDIDFGFDDSEDDEPATESVSEQQSEPEAVTEHESETEQEQRVESEPESTAEPEPISETISVSEPPAEDNISFNTDIKVETIDPIPAVDFIGGMSMSDDLLHEELRKLAEKIDEMERAVDSLEQQSAAKSEIGSGFSYEYDERYFAEEETPAYKYPELYKKSERLRNKKPVKTQSSKKQSSLGINASSLIKAGAIVAATAAALKLLEHKDD